MVVMNVVYAGGVSGGRPLRPARPPVVLALGFGVLALAQLVLGDRRRAGVALGVGLWGLHMGMTQGLFAALVADGSRRAARYGLRRFQPEAVSRCWRRASIAGSLWDDSARRRRFSRGRGSRDWR